MSKFEHYGSGGVNARWELRDGYLVITWTSIDGSDTERYDVRVGESECYLGTDSDDSIPRKLESLRQ